ncbi:STAS domain-containing protein [Streptomyces sp. NPDC051133]|uniref:STAS domain-containing protein n=1 Tax=Streptomyces sp. NPDC051133 TaxID=3155521 RepID=UPI00341624E5
MHDSARRAQSLTVPRPSPAGDGAGRRPLPPARVSASYTADGSRVRVTVTGELDRDAGTWLGHDLHEALAGSAGGLDLDLSGLDFCDCAGLRVLQELRRCALALGRTVVVRAGSPAFDRLLHLLGAQELFMPPGPEHMVPVDGGCP